MRKKSKFPRKVFLFFFAVVFLIYLQYLYVSLFPNVYGINMDDFAASRNIVSQTLYAERGTIYDSQGSELALEVSSYKVIAYLDSSRTGQSSVPYHVVDLEYTAMMLAEVLGGNKDYYLNLLDSDLYQTYLGAYGNINESKKNELENLKLPGISFEEGSERTYPYGAFASYNVGYAKTKYSLTVQKGLNYDLNYYLAALVDTKEILYLSNSKDLLINSNILTPLNEGTFTIDIYIDDIFFESCNIIVTNDEVDTILEEKMFGELGIESYYDEILRGENGYLSYQADREGYKIPNTNEERIEATDGSDIYLTIDSTVQSMVESAIRDSTDKYDPAWITLTVMNAKTGEILGNASTPTFDPNDLSSLVNYENPLTSFVYEPGSVMKTFTYMCALENGVYQGDATFESGSFIVEGEEINDWNKTGWGQITFDKGYQLSSNVAVSYLTQDYINGSQLKECFVKYGFGEETGINLPREMDGTLNFDYPYEIASASFGQGISTTALQHLQALTMIANDGDMISPSIVSKVVDSSGVETFTEVKIEENVVSETTTDYLKMLMYNTVHEDYNEATGTKYFVEGLDVIGKTGTAQVFDENLGAYLTNSYIYSFSGMFPYEDPEIIVFASIKDPSHLSSAVLSEMVTPVMELVGKYLGIIPSVSQVDSKKIIEIEYVKNKAVNTIKDDLEIKGLDVIPLGTGDVIIDQYPKEGTTLLSNDKIFLLTENATIPDMTGYSRIEAIALLNLLDIEYKIEGTGFVSGQSVLAGSVLQSLTLYLE